MHFFRRSYQTLFIWKMLGNIGLTMLTVTSIHCIVDNTILVEFIVTHFHLHFEKLFIQPENMKD
jgi:hypothetical protein